MRWHGGKESSRLARALDAGTSSRADDAAVEELIGLTDRLSRVDARDRLDPQFRAETRQRLIALAEQRAAGLAPAHPTPRRAGAHRYQPQDWGRRFAVAVAVVAVVLATAGLLTLAATDALPGDTLYAVKRGAEQVQLGLTWDRDERGFALLHLAETRLDEVTELVSEPGALGFGPPGIPLAAGAEERETVVETLAEMDRQTTAGISLLTASAVDSADQATLDILPTWASGQRDLLDALVAQMSVPEQDRAHVSMTLLDRVDDRAQMLALALQCDCLDEQDELGPVPCESCLSVPPERTGSSASLTPSSPATSTSRATSSESVPSPTS